MAAETKKKTTQTARGKNAASAKKNTATEQKKNGSSKKTPSRKPSTGPAKKQAGPSGFSKREADFHISDELLGWLAIAVNVLLLLSVYGFCGAVGKALRGFLFGMFGLLTWLLPFLFFFLMIFLIANHGTILSWIKAASAVLLYFSMCAIIELLTNRFMKSRAFMDYYLDSQTYRNGGGLTGGLLAGLFCPAFGSAGAYVLLITIIVICLIMITERSLWRELKRHSQRMAKAAMDDASIRMQRSENRRERRRLEQQQQRAAEQRRLRDEKRQLDDERRELSGEPRLVTNFSLTGDRRLYSDIHEVKAPVYNELPKRKETVIFGEETAQRKPEPQPARPQTAEPTSAEPRFAEPPRPSAAQPEDTFFDDDLDDEFDQDILIERGPLREEEPEPQWNEEPEPQRIEEPSQHSGFEQELRSRGKAQLQRETPPASNTEPAAAVPESAPKHNPRSSKAEQEQGIAQVAAQIQEQTESTAPAYVFPPIDLLAAPKSGRSGDSDDTLRSTARKLQQTLHNFGVEVTVSNVSCGPTVTRYELTPEQGVRVSKIVSLADDIKLNLAAADIRIEAPIPGKMAVGIEVPNKENSTVFLRELIESRDFQNHKSNLAFAAGKDIGGKVVVTDIAKMPHLLIAGATGSGKSVCINTLIMSILYKANPEDVRLIMIDPKVVELSVYNGIPHLLIPVVTDPKKAAGALNWAVSEMTERYQKFADVNVRDLKGYNAKVAALDGVEGISEEEKPQKMPQIVIIVDELADLMMVAPGEVEDAICRLAQLARAAGIHLIIATQRPSVNVITGLIKANMPSRIAFAVSSGVDSRTIIDMNGAEKLLGKGDMLFYPQGYPKPARVQGAFVSDEEVAQVVSFLTAQNQPTAYGANMEEAIQKASVSMADGSGAGDRDELFSQAARFIIDKDKASIGMIQRMFKVGFNRASRIMDQLAEAGIVGEEEGTKPRKILMSMEQFENMEF